MIRQKKTETLLEFRQRLKEALSGVEVKIVQIEFNIEKVIEFLFGRKFNTPFKDCCRNKVINEPVEIIILDFNFKFATGRDCRFCKRDHRFKLDYLFEQFKELLKGVINCGIHTAALIALKNASASHHRGVHSVCGIARRIYTHRMKFAM